MRQGYRKSLEMIPFYGFHTTRSDRAGSQIRRNNGDKIVAPVNDRWCETGHEGASAPWLRLTGARTMILSLVSSKYSLKLPNKQFPLKQTFALSS